MQYKSQKLSCGMVSCLLTIPLAAIGGNKATQSKITPNIIYILVDDMGIGDLGCYGQKIIKTPHIDAFARNGMLFTQHYSGSTVSAPSRCSLLTGKHTGHTYIRGNKGYTHENGFVYDLPLADEEVTIGELCKTKGYKTACCGKWGLGGPDSEGHPNRQGFDYFFGYLGQLNAHSYYPQQLFENNEAVVLNGHEYSHDLIMEKALNFIDRQADNSFFLYLTPTIPHAELIVPEADRAGFAGKFPEKQYVSRGGTYSSQEMPHATYAAMITRLDNDVQRIMDKLKEKGIYENTIVMFTSDNGVHKEGGADPDFFDSNGPFRGYKRDLYEGGIRTPFLVQWPNVISGGSVSYHVSAFWDVMPTICELLDINCPKISDGISFLPTLTGKGKQREHKCLYFEFHEEGGKQALLKNGWKLVKLYVNQPEKTRVELYNYYQDPAEIANVAAQYPEKVKELSALMDKQRTTNDNWNFVLP